MIISVRDYLLEKETKEGYYNKIQEMKNDKKFEEIERISFIKYEGNIEGETVFGVDGIFTEERATILVLRKY